tara:strand:- start:3151 stop:3387 length:237 start_codon:yes stop_codon:yes gene_type:complete
MAWKETIIELKSGKIEGMKNNSIPLFNMPIKTKIKSGDTFSCENISYSVTSIENSRDEFLEVMAIENDVKEEKPKEEA